MKLVLITDTHLGVRNSKAEFHRNMELFFKNIFFPYLQKNAKEIDGIIHSGDVFDDRRSINTLTAKWARINYFQPLQKYLIDNNIINDIVCGNHDAYFKEDLETNTLTEFIENNTFNNFPANKLYRIHTEYTEMPAYNMAFIPWITKKNREEILDKISKSTMKYAIGHLELVGLNFSKNQIATHGDDPEGFKRFDRVFSGHYHYKHDNGNITYLGAPTEHTWINVDIPCGFHVFDTVTGELEFIQNPYNMFEIAKLGSEKPFEKSHGRIFRVYTEGDEDQSIIDAYRDRLYKEANAVDVKIMSNRVKAALVDNEGSTINEVEDTPTFIENNVDDEEVANILLDAFNRAMIEE